MLAAEGTPDSSTQLTAAVQKKKSGEAAAAAGSASV
jgi:hypothetical protein